MRRSKQSYLMQINAGLRTCDLWVQEAERASQRNDCAGTIDVLMQAKYAQGQVREAIARVEKQRGDDPVLVTARRRLLDIGQQLEAVAQTTTRCFGRKPAGDGT